MLAVVGLFGFLDPLLRLLACSRLPATRPWAFSTGLPSLLVLPVGPAGRSVLAPLLVGLHTLPLRASRMFGVLLEVFWAPFLSFVAPLSLGILLPFFPAF